LSSPGRAAGAAQLSARASVSLTRPGGAPLARSLRLCSPSPGGGRVERDATVGTGGHARPDRTSRRRARHRTRRAHPRLGHGSAFSARRFRARLAELDIRHRRGGYRDPESQAFIESWFGKLKQREVWLNEYETLDDARRGIGGYVDRYHHRPHSGLDRTPLEVRRIWEDLPERRKQAA
jgi:transposase InsO family protein